ncbi:MAG TPA: hypothetical protein VF454_01755, partial [Gemmatimonadales bacterium]
MSFLTLLALQAVLMNPDTAAPIGIRFAPPSTPSAGYLALTTDAPVPLLAPAEAPDDTVRPRPR